MGSTSDGKLWHTIRQSNGHWLPFGDVLQQTGAPWQTASALGFRTAIEDVAIQTVGRDNDLLVLVVIRYTCATPLLFAPSAGKSVVCDSQSLQPMRPGQSKYKVWQTFRHSWGGWDRFVDVTAELGNHAFRRIRLARMWGTLIYFCGASTGGDVFLFRKNLFNGPSPWSDARNVKVEAAFDPGPATDVACSDNKFSPLVSVAMAAKGRVYHTFSRLSISMRRIRIYQQSNTAWTISQPALGSQSRCRTSISPRLTGTPNSIWSPVHRKPVNITVSLTTRPTRRAAGQRLAMSARVGRPGRVVATAITNVSGDLHLYNVTDEGEIWIPFAGRRMGGGPVLPPLRQKQATWGGSRTSPQRTSTIHQSTPQDL